MSNLKLRGNTYDARHLDRFLDSEFGERSLSPYRAQAKSTLETDAVQATNYKTLVAEKMPEYITKADAIKPTISFLNLPRDRQIFNHYVDLQGGPSSLQKRTSIPTLYER